MWYGSCNDGFGEFSKVKDPAIREHDFLQRKPRSEVKECGDLTRVDFTNSKIQRSDGWDLANANWVKCGCKASVGSGGYHIWDLVHGTEGEWWHAGALRIGDLC
jgi:hypothetical protein